METVVAGQQTKVMSFRAWLRAHAIESVSNTVQKGPTSSVLFATKGAETITIVIGKNHGEDIPVGTPVKNLLGNSITLGQNANGEPRWYLGKPASSNQVSVDSLLG